MTLKTICCYPIFIIKSGSFVRNNNCRLSPGNSPFWLIFVRDCKLSLSPQELLIVIQFTPVRPVVEDCVLGCVVPLVEIEHSVEVHVSAQRSGPLSFPQTGSSPNNERLWSIFLRNVISGVPAKQTHTVEIEGSRERARIRCSSKNCEKPTFSL